MGFFEASGIVMAFYVYCRLANTAAVIWTVISRSLLMPCVRCCLVVLFARAAARNCNESFVVLPKIGILLHNSSCGLVV